MKTTISILTISLFTLLLFSCDPVVRRDLSIQNKSNKVLRLEIKSKPEAFDYWSQGNDTSYFDSANQLQVNIYRFNTNEELKVYLFSDYGKASLIPSFPEVFNTIHSAQLLDGDVLNKVIINEGNWEEVINKKAIKENRFVIENGDIN